LNIKKEGFKLILINVIFTISCLCLYHFVFLQEQQLTERVSNTAKQVVESDLLLSAKLQAAYRSAEPGSFIQAAEQGRRGVVFIKCDAEGAEKDIFGMNTGSGVVISINGHIITNYHVVKGAQKISVTLNDNRVFNADILGSDPNTDLAILKINAENLDFLTFGNSDSIQIGEWVLAVGNPFKLQSTVTAGIVSAKARNINLLENQGIESFIQTDAAVNPGNSGGALINTQGDLVGICTAIQSNTGKYEGFSFAIPSNLVRKVAADIQEFGVVQRGWLGVDIENINSDLASKLGLPFVSGVYIASVSKDGGAQDAGVKKDDVVLMVNENQTQNISEFMETIGTLRPGDDVLLKIVRSNKEIFIKAKLRNQLNTTDLIGTYDHGILKKIGVEIRNPDSYERSILSSDGVVIVSVKIGSVIDKSKMEAGYFITKVNHKEIKSASEFIEILDLNRGKTVFIEGFYPKIPGDYPYTFQVPN
jgi:Do/DeqQ family serine protease